jgi:hypothetical protein
MVYVDPLTNYGNDTAPRCFRNKASCHMYADTEVELHSCAAYIGLKRSWFQNESLQHYDLTANKRIQAIAAGVQETDHRHMVKYLQWQRQRSRS